MSISLNSDGALSSTESLRRFSLVKRKPAPSASLLHPAEFHVSLALDRETNNVAPPSNASLDSGSPKIPVVSVSDPATEDFWNSLDSSDSESEARVSPHQTQVARPRAHTVPSRPFSNLARVPPPIVDKDLLASSHRATTTLRPASLAFNSVGNPISSDAHGIVRVLSTGAGGTSVLAAPVPPAMAIRTRPSRSSILTQKPKKTAGRISVASISSPSMQDLPQPPSMMSQTSSNTSMFSLSAFPLPPATIPPMPRLPLNTVPTSDALSPSHSFILEVDPPLAPPNLGPESSSVSAPNLTHRVDAVEAFPTAHSSASLAVTKSAADKGKGRAAAPPILRPQEVPKEPYFDFGEPPDSDTFDQTRLPTRPELEEAAALPVISESGVRVPFGSLWRNQKTVVCFIRHFWCPLCQDYMFSISQNISAEVLHSAGVQLVVISNGSYEMIKAYRRIFRTPFAVYTDPTHKVYNTLGMTLQTMEKGPKGTYIRHGMMGGIGWVVVNALKSGMPVWRQGGEISQLGGEFVLGPGIACSWAHRMRYTRDHIPILKVVEAAGVDMYTPLHRIASSTGGSFLGMSPAEESKWMDRRRKVLKKLKLKKMSRRGGEEYIDTASLSTATNSSSKRSSMQSHASMGSACSWNPATEEAINVGLTNRDMDIIEEVEEEERAEAVEEPGAASDTKTLESNDFSEGASEVESSATEFSVDVVEVSFNLVHHGSLDSKSEDDDERTVSTRSSCSSLGSGYNVAFSSHSDLFRIGEKLETLLRPSISQSSLGSVY